MRTSIGSLALASFLVAPLAASAQEIAWRGYHEGQEQGQKAGKPLAVFAGIGPAGPEQLIEEGSFSPEVRKILADGYVCVYLDANRPADATLIRQFGITRNKGVILSDRTGNVQAFFHDGTLVASDLTRQLRQFADPNVVVHTTHSNAPSRVSYYPPDSTTPGYNAFGGSVVPAIPYFPQSFQPSFAPMMRGGGGC
jgi:hypothetical protein